MTVNDQLPDPQSLGYEEARDELVRIVQSLEGGQAPLEATLTLWERGGTGGALLTDPRWSTVSSHRAYPDAVTGRALG